MHTEITSCTTKLIVYAAKFRKKYKQYEKVKHLCKKIINVYLCIHKQILVIKSEIANLIQDMTNITKGLQTMLFSDKKSHIKL